VSPTAPPASRFVGQAVAVTGGSRGIGRAIALAFAREGADLVLNYAGNHAAAAAVAAEIEGLGRRSILVPGSVADPDVGTAIVAAAIAHFERLDILVNNAGITRDGNLMMLRDEAWREVVDINLSGTYYCCRAAIHAMRQRGCGVIVNMTSTAGIKGRAGQATYAATKGAVIALTKTLAQELGPFGIRVNAIAPGFVETDMVAGLLARPDIRQPFLDGTPLGRFGTPEDIASAALFLGSAASSFVSGHVLLVNGGLFM
jgi:3-oxoacyl-[acyl-carrier protein] reductase